MVGTIYESFEELTKKVEEHYQSKVVYAHYSYLYGDFELENGKRVTLSLVVDEVVYEYVW